MGKVLTVTLIVAGLAGAAPTQAFESLKLGPGEKIVLDGRIDEPAWERATASSEFYEIFPQDKVKARVRTEVRFAHDGSALYAAVRAFDPDMSQLRAPFARRDNVFSDQDFVVLFIDPVGTRKFAHFVRANPRGVIADGLFNEDSGNEDFSPDFDVEVATGRFEGGWTVEFRIPFSSLRYTDPAPEQWSVLVFRNFPREQRYRIASSPLPRDANCFICLNEPLTGLTDLPSTRHLAVTPNFTVRSTRERETGSRDRRESEVVPSLELKWRPRSDVIVDAMVNPDFSQVELDVPQLAGNAQFALFFNEKRPFFLEGADILEAPLRAIYSRAITDPSWGARLTKRDEGFDATLLTARDDGGGLVLLPGTYRTDFAAQKFKSLATIGRVRAQVNGVSVGALFTDRSIQGGGYNRVAGPDLVWFPDRENRIRAQLLGSWTTAQAGADGRIANGPLTSDHAALVDWRFNGERWDQYLDLEDVGRAFRADNGFIAQNGYRRLYSETTRKYRDALGLNEISPYLNVEQKTSLEGRTLYRQNHLGLRLVMPRATTFAMEWRPNSRVAVRENGGLLRRDQIYFSLESNPASWFTRLFTEIAFGDRVDVANNRVGRGSYTALEVKVRPHLRAELEYRLDNDVIDTRESVEGSKRVLLQRAQQALAIWHFSARDSLRSIWQRTSTRRAPSLWEATVSSREQADTLSLVYAHRRGLGLVFYLGGTLGRTLDADTGYRRRQVEIFVKGSWTFDVL